MNATLRETSSQSANLLRALRDDKRTVNELLCRTGVVPSVKETERPRMKLYKNRQVCLITRRDK